MSGAWLITVLTALSVDGTAECPRTEELAARVVHLDTRHRAHLTQLAARTIELALFDENGAPLAKKTLEALTCRGLLEAGAATLLAWEAQFPPTPVVAPKRTPLPSLASEAVPAPADGAASPTAWRLDLGLIGALVGFSPTGGLMAAGLLGPSDARWKARLHAAALLPVEASAVNGNVSWTRPALGLGATVRMVDSVLRLEAGLSLEAGVLVAWGRGFEKNSTALVFDPGGELSIRLSRALSDDFELFLQLALNLSFVQQSIRIAGIDVFVPLPPVTTGLRLGLAFGR